MIFRLPCPVFAPEGDAPASAPAAPVASAPVADVAPAPASVAAPAPAVEAPAAPVVEATPVAAATEAAPSNEFPPTAMEAGLPAAEPAKEGEPAKDARTDAKPEAAQGDKPAADKDAAPETADAPGQEPPAPPSYDFKFPEDIKSDAVNKEVMSAFAGLLGENQVKPEAAQKLLDMHIEQMRSLSTQVQERLAQNQWDVFRQQQNSWLDEIKADPELGGSRFQTAMKTCAKVIEQYPGNAEEKQAIWNDLRATGMGNSPRFARLFHWLGSKYFSEASMVPAPAPRTAQLSPQQRGERRYSGTQGQR